MYFSQHFTAKNFVRKMHVLLCLHKFVVIDGQDFSCRALFFKDYLLSYIFDLL